MTNSQKSSWLPLIAVGVLLGLAALIFSAMQVRNPPVEQRIANRYVLPVGFTGNIQIIYDVEGEEPLIQDEGYQIIPIPRSGRLLTSTPMEYGRAEDQFVRKVPEGGTEILPVQYLGARRNGLVGDEKEFFESPEELAGRPPPDERLSGKPYEILVIRSGID